MKLTGADDAKISGTVSISASVAGGYEETFVQKGCFTVSNIEFTSTTGNTSLSANGNTNNKSQGNDKRADETLLVIENCTFHNQLYSYVNDPDSENQVKKIINNEFVASSDIGEGVYAFSCKVREQGAFSKATLSPAIKEESISSLNQKMVLCPSRIIRLR